jgi:hypothetical protein
VSTATSLSEWLSWALCELNGRPFWSGATGNKGNTIWGSQQQRNYPLRKCSSLITLHPYSHLNTSFDLTLQASNSSQHKNLKSTKKKLLIRSARLTTKRNKRLAGRTSKYYIISTTKPLSLYFQQTITGSNETVFRYKSHHRTIQIIRSKATPVNCLPRSEP